MRLYPFTQTLVVLFLFLFTALQGQDQFERLYRVNDGRFFAPQALATTSGGGYLILSSTAEPSVPAASSRMNVTRLDQKGELVWSKDYPLGPGNYGAGDILVQESDTFYFSFSRVTNNPDSLTEHIFKCAPDGEVIWSRAYANSNVDQAFPTNIRKDSFTNIYHAANITPDLGFTTEVYLGSLDTEGALLWGKRFTIENLNLGSLILNDIQITPDSGLIACGVIRPIDIADQPESVFLLKMDSEGTTQWSRAYAISDGLTNFQIDGLAIAVQDTSGYVVGGSVKQIDAEPSRGLILRVDSIGQALSATSLVADTALMVSSVIPQGDQLIIGGAYQATQLRGYAASLSGDTLINWTSLHKADPDGPISQLDYPLKRNPAVGGFAQLERIQEGSQAQIYLVKMDSEGETLCNETFDFSILSLDSLLISDTLLLEETELLGEQEIPDSTDTYNGFDLITVSLINPEPFCEDSMILHTFDATVPVNPDVVTYEWSTGETTPTITVMEEGQYIVTVTIFEDFCYQLCDTGFIATIGPPQPSILVQDSLCLTGLSTLLAQAGGADDYLWSTGEETPIIQVDETGTYTVTASNKCGSGSASVTVEETFPTAEILVQGNVCENGNALLVASVLNTLDVEWNDGSSGESLAIDAPGTYSLLATNLCGTDQASIDIPSVAPEIAIFPQDSFCQSQQYILIAAADGLPVTWSTGETTDTIFVTEPGDYTVTTANFCAESSESLSLVQADFSVKQKCVPEGFFCVNLPSIFTPNNDNNNDLFSPVIICPDVTNYNFKIFNRWGDMVFETDDPEQGWDGRVDGKIQPMDVYAWLLNYDVEGMAQQRSGEVSLVR